MWSGDRKPLLLKFKQMTKQEAIQYKTLTYSGFFVDYSLLEKGIYASTKPCIFQLNESIESLIKYYRIILK